MSEPEPIFFPITAAAMVKWPICLSRHTGHAWLVGVIGTLGEDKKWWVHTGIVKFPVICCETSSLWLLVLLHKFTCYDFRLSWVKCSKHDEEF